MDKILSGLYYPFSRPIDIASLKQMLLVFENVVFLDPVDDDSWRAKLFQELETQEDKRFAKYQQVHEELTLLFQAGAARRVDPTEVTSLESPLTTAAALSDLLDQQWSTIASNPQAFSMPHRRLGPVREATWQIFLPKMPLSFVNALQSQETFRKHLIHEGDIYASWTVSYEAGSAVSISVHLAAAEELNLAPITDSAMHHQLLIRKLIRQRAYPDQRSRPVDDEIVRQLAHSTATAIIDVLLPKSLLDQIRIEEILHFREQTRALRQQAITEIGNRLSVLSRIPDVEDLLVASREIQQSIRSDLRMYRAEVAATRDRLWPTLVTALSANLAGGSVAAVAMNYIGGPGYALAASVVAGSLALLKGALDLRAERKKAEASHSPAITYLARVTGLHGR
ncbi:MAG TPA: hypothetical protein VF290_18295 [Pyrinomonadaceae bacterium]